MSGGLVVPGPGGVPDLGKGAPTQPSVAEVLAAQIMALQQQVDMLFQAMMRLHSGWTAEQVIEDMELNVAPAPPRVAESLREAVEAVVAEDEAPAPAGTNRAARRASARQKGKA